MEISLMSVLLKTVNRNFI